MLLETHRHRANWTITVKPLANRFVSRGCPCSMRGRSRRSVPLVCPHARIPLAAALANPARIVSGGMRASSVLRSCRRRAARFGDRLGRILLTAILPAAPPSLGWFGRCAAARPEPAQARARLRPVHATAHKAPAYRVDSGRTRCDSLVPLNAGPPPFPPIQCPARRGGRRRASVPRRRPEGFEPSPMDVLARGVSPSAVFVLGMAGGGCRVRGPIPRERNPCLAEWTAEPG